MFVKYVGPAHSRTIARSELGGDPESEEILVWDPLNAMTVELTEEEYDNLGRLTFRGDWEVLDEMPELPAVSIDVATDQAVMPETGTEASAIPEDEEIVDA